MGKLPSWLYYWLNQHVSLFRAREMRAEVREEIARYGRPCSHEDFVKKYGLQSGMEKVMKMTRPQLERMVLARPSWRTSLPTGDIFDGAWALIVFGELYGPDSQIGLTRNAALRTLRRRLTLGEIVELEHLLADYEASAPHPAHDFGPGWTDTDALLASYEEHDRRFGDDLTGLVGRCEDAIADARVDWYLKPIRLSPPRRRIVYSMFSILRRLRS